MEQLCAKQFSTRERALSDVHHALATQPATSPRETTNLIRATCQVIVKGFDDKVFSVSESEAHVCITCRACMCEDTIDSHSC